MNEAGVYIVSYDTYEGKELVGCSYSFVYGRAEQVKALVDRELREWFGGEGEHNRELSMIEHDGTTVYGYFSAFNVLPVRNLTDSPLPQWIDVVPEQVM